MEQVAVEVKWKVGTKLEVCCRWSACVILVTGEHSLFLPILASLTEQIPVFYIFSTIILEARPDHEGRP